MRRILLVDVDLVVAPSDTGWWKYLRERGQQMYNLGDYEPAPYNLGKLFPSVKEPYEYWKDLDYFSMSPIEGSIEALHNLSQYFGIVFASAEKCGYSSKNKKSWLLGQCPFDIGYVSTEDKHLLDSERVVAMIDDRMSHLKGFDYNKRILFETNYTQDVVIDVAMSFKTWDNSVVRQICERYL